MIDQKKMSVAYAEVLGVIETLGDMYKNKIPPEYIQFWKENRDPNVTKVIYRNDESLNSLTRETLVLISWLNLKFWCEDEKEKERLQKIYDRNEKVYQLSQYKRLREQERAWRKREQ